VDQKFQATFTSRPVECFGFTTLEMGDVFFVGEMGFDFVPDLFGWHPSRIELNNIVFVVRMAVFEFVLFVAPEILAVDVGMSSFLEPLNCFGVFALAKQLFFVPFLAVGPEAGSACCRFFFFCNFRIALIFVS